MDVLITGGSGFVGTRLIRRLVNSNHKITNIDKKNSYYFPNETVLQNICDISGLGRNAPSADVLVHLAAEHRDDVRPKSLYDEVNVEGTRNICRLAEEKGINRIVFTSSVAVYGFAEVGTKENGAIFPFNDYGRTKYEAEEVLREWFDRDSENRSLVIIRPTVIFGEQNRGNVYNLLNQIASGRFLMVGDGRNRKSMAYVENVSAFIEHALTFETGYHLYNYIDKPDLDMNTLVSYVYKSLGKASEVKFRIPYSVGYGGGMLFDAVARITGKQFSVSSIRVKKFCTDTVFGTSVAETGFAPEVSLSEGLSRTIQYEFIDDNSKEPLFYTE